MSKTWAITSPTGNGLETGDTAELQWKIENFNVVWGRNGRNGMDSPKFEIKSENQSKKVHLQVRSLFDDDGAFYLKPPFCNYEREQHRYRQYFIMEGDVAKGFCDFFFLNFEICNDLHQQDQGQRKKFDMAGSLHIDTQEKNLSGMFGIHEDFQFRQDWVFKNKSQLLVKSAYNTGSYGHHSQNYFDNIFCVPKTTASMVLKIKLTTPVPTQTTTDEFSYRQGGPPRLLADMKSMLSRASENGDFTIQCGGKIFPCHEFILRARSSVMEGMLDNQMLERMNRSMALEDVGSNTVAAALEYMYTGEIVKEIESVQELIYFAEKYAMDDLMALCFQKLPQDDEDVVVDCLIMADKLSLDGYKKHFIHRIQENKSKFLNDEVAQEKLKEFPHLLLEMLKM